MKRTLEEPGACPKHSHSEKVQNAQDPLLSSVCKTAEQVRRQPRTKATSLCHQGLFCFLQIFPSQPHIPPGTDGLKEVTACSPRRLYQAPGPRQLCWVAHVETDVFIPCWKMTFKESGI